MSAPQRAPENMLDSALDYLGQGMPVFPVCSPAFGSHGHWDGSQKRDVPCSGDKIGKRPMVPWEAVQTGLPTGDQVASWWGRWPEANIGMATGALSGVVVLDADSGDARKTAMSKGVPSTPCVWTGKPGGCHFHLRHPGGPVRNFARKLPGLDFRGDGGYVLLPPSLHYSGARYRWVEGTEGFSHAAMPSWLHELIGGAGPESERQDRSPLDLGLIQRGIPEGQRDDLLWRYACKLRDDDIPRAYAELLVSQAARLCRPPFDETLAIEKVARAYQEYAPATHLTAASAESIEIAETDDPYPLQNLAELVLLANETLEPLVDGLIWGNRLHWIFSPPGAGKTIFLTALGMHVAAGRDFCGRKVKQGPVLFIEEDSPLSVLAEYVEMIAEIYDFDLDTMPFWVNKVQGLRLTNAEGLERAWQAIMKCPEFPILAFFDASERLVPSEKFSSRELDFLAKMLQRYIGAGGTPGVIDHTKRPQMVKGKIAEPDDPMELLYGARAKQAISDVMLYFSGTFKAGEVNIKYAKFRGETPPNVGVQFDPELGFKIKSDARNARTPAEQQVMKWLNNNTPGTWHQLADIIAGARVPERTGKRAISNLKKRGWVERDDSPKKAGAQYRANTEIGAVFE